MPTYPNTSPQFASIFKHTRPFTVAPTPIAAPRLVTKSVLGAKAVSRSWSKVSAADSLFCFINGGMTSKASATSGASVKGHYETESNTQTMAQSCLHNCVLNWACWRFVQKPGALVPQRDSDPTYKLNLINKCKSKRSHSLSHPNMCSDMFWLCPNLLP